MSRIKIAYRLSVVMLGSGLILSACNNPARENNTTTDTTKIEADTSIVKPAPPSHDTLALDTTAASHRHDSTTFEERTKAKIKEIEAEMKALRAKVKTKSDEANMRINKQLDKLEVQTDKLKQKLNRSGKKSKEEWNEFKKDIQAGTDSLEVEYKKLRKK